METHFEVLGQARLRPRLRAKGFAARPEQVPALAQEIIK